MGRRGSGRLQTWDDSLAQHAEVAVKRYCDAGKSIGHDTAYLDKHKIGENIGWKSGWEKPLPKSELSPLQTSPGYSSLLTPEMSC